jgi:hypothetical protein
MYKQEQKTAKTLTMIDSTGSRQTVSTVNGEEQKRTIGKREKKFRYTDFNTARNLARYALFLKNPKSYIGA